MPEDAATGTGSAQGQVIGYVTGLQGEVWVRGADGVERELRPGDSLRAGDEVLTAKDGSVSLVLADGGTLTVGAGAALLLALDMLDPALLADPEALDAALDFLAARWSSPVGPDADAEDDSLDLTSGGGTPVLLTGAQGSTEADGSNELSVADGNTLPDGTPGGSLGQFPVPTEEEPLLGSDDGTPVNIAFDTDFLFELETESAHSSSLPSFSTVQEFGYAYLLTGSEESDVIMGTSDVAPTVPIVQLTVELIPHADGGGPRFRLLREVSDPLDPRPSSSPDVFRILGLAGDDHLTGHDADDWIDGDGGDDMIFGLAGADGLDGGSGADLLDGGTGDDRLLGGDGDDQLLGGAGADSIDGGAGNDRLDGGPGDDLLYGRDGADVLDGGDGVNELRGGDGNDELNGGPGRDLLFDGSGDDRVAGGDGNDQIFIGGGSDTLAGGQGADFFTIEVSQANDGDQNRIRDFSVADGDVLRFDDLLPGTSDVTGYLSIRQFSDGLHLAVDRNGTDPGGVQFTTVLEGFDLTGGGSLPVVQLGYSVVFSGGMGVDLTLNFS